MDEKVDIYMPIYIGDYLADTSDLTTEEHGAYLLILMAMWRTRAPLPLHRLRPISKVAAARWASVWSVIERFFDVVDGDLVTQKRLFRELETSLTKKRRASDRGALGAQARWGKVGRGSAQAMAQASTEHGQGTAKGGGEQWPARLTVTDLPPGESRSGSIPDPDPSRQAPQDHPAPARDPLPWDSAEWLERFGQAWAAAKGFERYGITEADLRAQGKLQATLVALPLADRLAAQRNADRMFAAFFARAAGRAAEEGHPFYFFAPAFNGLRTAPPPARATGPARAGSAERTEEILSSVRDWTPREASG